MLIEGLIAALEMHNGGGRRAAYSCDIFGQASEDRNSIIGAGSIIGRPRATAISWYSGNWRKSRLEIWTDGNGRLQRGRAGRRTTACRQQQHKR